MIVNQDKSTCQFFTQNRQSFTPGLTYKGIDIQYNYSKYLGYILDPPLNCKNHAENLNNKAIRRLP